MQKVCTNYLLFLVIPRTARHNVIVFKHKCYTFTIIYVRNLKNLPLLQVLTFYTCNAGWSDHILRFYGCYHACFYSCQQNTNTDTFKQLFFSVKLNCKLSLFICISMFILQKRRKKQTL